MQNMSSASSASLRFVLLLSLTAALPLAAAQRIANANVQTRPAAAGLEKEVRALASSAEPVWIAWSVPMIDNHHRSCSVLLEHGSEMNTGDRGHAVLDANLLVFVRASGGNIEKIRSYSEECEIDGGGRTVHLLSGVRPADSVNFLASFAASADRKLSDGAVAAIAQHADPAADTALDRLVAANQPEALRDRVVFWLGAARGRPGYERLSKIVREDPSAHIRDKAVFALYVSHEPEAVDAIIAAAKNDSDAHVRSQALFWLGQKAGQKAAGEIAAAVENDPDTDVKKKAVFALSQLPKDEGVPRLIEVARTNKNPAVRKQAIFWLGQSHDPRALQFFEDILKR